MAYVDGGSHGSPGPSGVGVVIEQAGADRLSIAKSIGRRITWPSTSRSWRRCNTPFVHADALHVYSDSEIVVRQMTGQYACRSPRLYSLNWTCRKLARSLEFSIAHVGRELNLEANELANHAARGHKAVQSA